MKTTTKKITVQAIDFKLSRKLAAFARRHVAKLDTFSDRIIESRVSLKLDTSVPVEKRVCTIMLVMPGQDLFVSKSSQTFEESIATATDAIKRQLEHWKASVSGQG